jgi:lipid-binding SYLF domain-containing protein
MRFLFAILTLSICAAIATPAQAADPTKEELQADARQAADETLKILYAQAPPARKAVESAAGYAAFSNFGMKIFFAGGGHGSGVAVNNGNDATTYMKMVEVQAGLGLGVKKFRVVFVFENLRDLNDFIASGWEFGGQATAAAKMGEDGTSFQGAVSIKPGVWVYQITESGLAAELTGKGTKYYKDDELN